MAGWDKLSGRTTTGHILRQRAHAHTAQSVEASGKPRNAFSSLQGEWSCTQLVGWGQEHWQCGTHDTAPLQEQGR